MSAMDSQEFSLSVCLLTGKYVAADLASRDGAEWPPHPGRLYMALVASVFETDPHPARVAAIEWLGTLGPPDIVAGAAFERTPVEIFVPINDRVHDTKEGALPGLPGLKRSRQPRYFPTSIPEHDQVDFVYRTPASELKRHADALSTVAADVVRIGHSSSLVAVAFRMGAPGSDGRTRWVASAEGSSLLSMRLRVPDEHSFALLESSFGRDQREAFHVARANVVTAKGKAVKTAKERFKELTGLAYKANLKPAPPAPARIARYVDYRAQKSSSHTSEWFITPFDDAPLLLAKLDGPILNLVSTLQLIKVLRGLLLSRVRENAPEWFTGHATDGSASRAPHLAMVPLPFVGRQHADGHLLGVGICVPRDIDEREIATYLGPILIDQTTGEPNVLTLKLGRLGTWELALEMRSTPPRALQASSWVGDKTSREWATTTPIVLERFPKQDRQANHGAWLAEVEDLVCLSCRHAGLPEPVALSVGRNAWCIGVPRALPRSNRHARRARSERGPLSDVVGSGFPLFSSSVQVHAKIAFSQPVRGPVLLGKGRFQGYGFCRPAAKVSRDPASKEQYVHEAS